MAHPTTVSQFTYADAKAFKAQIRAYVSPKTKAILKDNSVNIVLRNLHTAFEEAVKLKYVSANPFKDVQQIPITKRVPRYLTLEQIKDLKAAAKNSPGPDTPLLVLTFLYTGMRLQEVLSLQWESIDLKRGIVYLHGAEGWEPKDREEHAIGLHEDLWKALKKKEKTSNFVFPGRRGKRDQTALSHLFGRLYRRAGINAKGLHILRHTFATHFPGNPKVLQRILGHSDPRTTERYAHVTTEELMAVRSLKY